MVTRDMAAHAKPDPDLFLAAAALAALAADPRQATVVGDSVWDLLAARRAGSLGIGPLSGVSGTGRMGSVRARGGAVWMAHGRHLPSVFPGITESSRPRMKRAGGVP
jgi:phosphoglycolate phosphatase-like HAD superfamily hydrolase